jgi:putative spermidine/putrescine transport system permease protein
MIRRSLTTLLALCLLLPLLILLYLSVLRQWAFPALLDVPWTMQQWTDAASAGGLLGSLLLSVALSGSLAVLATAAGFVISRQLMSHPRAKILLSLAYYPYLIAPVILGVMLQYYFIRLGITGTLSGVMLAQFLFVFPYAVLYFAAFWTPRIRDMEGQSLTLGATQGQTFRRVLLPAARSWLALCAFQCFLLSWFEYGMTQYVGIGKVGTLTVRTMQYIKEANPHLAAVAACMMLLPLLLFPLLNRQFRFRNPEDHD